MYSIFNLLKNLEWQSTQRQTEKLKLHFEKDYTPVKRES